MPVLSEGLPPDVPHSRRRRLAKFVRQGDLRQGIRAEHARIVIDDPYGSTNAA
jgi:hypothetical protein